jgi:NAD(P)-dependent dehydrogenase (short-subunit alcohol dehydrogenase family)
MNTRVWFITGGSSGLGNALTKAALNSGYKVAATFRNKAQADQFSKLSNALGLVADIRNAAEIEAAVLETLKQFGQIDVVVNNAGIGFAGAVEEASAEEVREVVEINFIGAFNVLKAALPVMRAVKSGYIIQISSHSGIKAAPGFGIYNASKFALEGLSEAMAAEIAPLGIRMTIVEPGPFRTAFAGQSLREAAAVLPDYSQTAGEFRTRLKLIDGKQEGDPDKAAAAIVALTETEHPPLRMPLGKIALVSIQAKIDSLKNDLEHGRATAESVVFAD